MEMYQSRVVEYRENGEPILKQWFAVDFESRLNL